MTQKWHDFGKWRANDMKRHNIINYFEYLSPRKTKLGHRHDKWQEKDTKMTCEKIGYVTKVGGRRIIPVDDGNQK